MKKTKLTSMIFSLILASCITVVGCGSDKKEEKKELPKQTQQTQQAKQEVQVKYGYISGSDVILREGPSTSTKILDSMNKGYRVEILEEVKTGQEYPWFKIKTEKGQIGYAFGKFVSNSEIVASKNEDNTSINQPANSMQEKYGRLTVKAALDSGVIPKDEAKCVTDLPVNPKTGCGIYIKNVEKRGKITAVEVFIAPGIGDWTFPYVAIANDQVLAFNTTLNTNLYVQTSPGGFYRTSNINKIKEITERIERTGSL